MTGPSRRYILIYGPPVVAWKLIPTLLIYSEYALYMQLSLNGYDITDIFLERRTFCATRE